MGPTSPKGMLQRHNSEEMSTQDLHKEEVFRTRSQGIGATGVHDQYSDGRAAKVWHLYMGGKQRTDEYKDAIVKIMKEHHVENVLDAAAGTGVDSVLLIEAGFRVKSVDASDKMLKYCYKLRWEKRKDGPLFDEWEIGEGDWLDLENCEDTINHPDGGYDCVICIGNSFSHLPDFSGDGSSHRLAIRNFHKMLKPGGILIIDHRNYDYIITTGKLPLGPKRLYYAGDRVHKIQTSVLTVDGSPNMVTLDYEIDISDHMLAGEEATETRIRDDGTRIPVCIFRLSYHPHTLDKFTTMLKDEFGDDAEYKLLSDFKEDPSPDYVAGYYIHVITRK